MLEGALIALFPCLGFGMKNLTSYPILASMSVPYVMFTPSLRYPYLMCTSCYPNWSMLRLFDNSSGGYTPGTPAAYFKTVFAHLIAILDLGLSGYFLL